MLHFPNSIAFQRFWSPREIKDMEGRLCGFSSVHIIPASITRTQHCFSFSKAPLECASRFNDLSTTSKIWWGVAAPTHFLRSSPSVNISPVGLCLVISSSSMIPKLYTSPLTDTSLLCPYSVYKQQSTVSKMKKENNHFGQMILIDCKVNEISSLVYTCDLSCRRI